MSAARRLPPTHLFPLAALCAACAGLSPARPTPVTPLRLDVPRITAVETDAPDGSYGPGDTIDLVLTVSERVHGNLVALLSSGGTVALSCEGLLCAGRYLVREGEAARWLTVETFAGRLVDDAGNPFDGPVPPEDANLAHRAALTIDPRLDAVPGAPAQRLATSW